MAVRSWASWSATAKPKRSGPVPALVAERGLTGVRLVISDSHHGLVKANRKVMPGAAWQRCRFHFLRNVFSVIPKGAAEMVAATIRTLFAQPTAEAVRAHLDTVADMLGEQFPKVKEMLREAKEDLTAFTGLPSPALE